MRAGSRELCARCPVHDVRRFVYRRTPFCTLHRERVFGLPEFIDVDLPFYAPSDEERPSLEECADIRARRIYYMSFGLLRNAVMECLHYDSRVLSLCNCEPTWAKMLTDVARKKMHLHWVGDAEDVAEIVEDMMAASEYDDYVSDITFGLSAGRRALWSIRLLLIWVMKHQPFILETLLHDGFAHVGQKLFPESLELADSHDGCRQSLLGMAVFDARAPEAAAILCAHGANPNGCLNATTLYGAQFGPSALVMDELYRLHIHKQSPQRTTTTKSLLQALFEAGGRASPASRVCDNIFASTWPRPDLTGVCRKFRLLQQRERRQRWQNVVAAVAIVSFWVRETCAPDSKAARAAIARCADRAAGQEPAPRPPHPCPT